MKRRITLVCMFCICFCLAFAAAAVYADSDVELGANGIAAKELYGVSDDKIVSVDADADSYAIQDAIDEIESKGSEDAPAMVYVPDGNHNLAKFVAVYENVVLVSEKGAMYTGGSERRMLKIGGSVYGGTFDGSKIDTICMYEYVKFSGKNGEVRNTVLKNAKIDGIHYGANSKNGLYFDELGGAKAVKNTITGCKTNGITAMNTGSFSLIEGNKISNVGTGNKGSGISVTLANVTTIKKNTIKNVKGHGISTDTGFKKQMQNKVTISNITGNTIEKVGVHGIWVDTKTTIKKINKNKINKSKKCGIAIEKNGVIKDMNNNTITSSKQSNITMNGKGSKLTVGSGNTITKSKAIGIMVQAKATLVIKGKNNVIKNNKNDIRVMKKKGAKFTLKNKKKNKIPNIRIV